MANHQYIIDANCFIQAHRVTYPIDIFPFYWSCIAALLKDRQIYSLDIIRRELCQGGDSLSSWISSEIPEECFADESISEEKFSNVVSYIYNCSQYTQSAKRQFLADGVADPWLVAFALEKESTIVSYEVSAPESRRRIKLPDVCSHFGVRCITPIEMLREMQVCFSNISPVLATSSIASYI